MDRSALNGVSCTSATACTAVGLSASKRSGIFGPGAFAERGDGSRWTSLGALNPPDAVSGSILSAVSCVSATRCAAVGQDFRSGSPERALAEVWDGSAWTIQTTPGLGSAVIVNLAGVSCASASACTAVGITARNSGIPLTLAEHLTGGKWTTDATVDQTGAQVSSLRGVSCPSAVWCMAVGTSRASTRTLGNYPPFAGAQTALSERYDGSTWHIEAVQNPPDGAGTTLDGVSCLSSSVCVAVGSYENPSGTRLPLAEGWDGRRWAIQQVATPANIQRAHLGGVSCTAADACTSVGGFTDLCGQDSTLTERWDGRRWTIQPTPKPAGARTVSLGKVSCLSGGACVAVGSYIASDVLGNTRLFALAEHWDGAVWGIEPVPDPVPSFGATVADDFRDVSCTSPDACLAVGDYTTFDRPYPAPTLAERWDAHTWTWQPTPNPPGVTDAFTSLSGISCGSATSCLAVGFSYNGTGTDSGVHTIGER